MATTYSNVQLSYVDDSGNVNVIYPVTKGKLVDLGTGGNPPLEEIMCQDFYGPTLVFSNLSDVMDSGTTVPTTTQTDTTSTFNVTQVRSVLSTITNKLQVSKKPLRDVNIQVIMTWYESEHWYAISCDSLNDIFTNNGLNPQRAFLLYKAYDSTPYYSGSYSYFINGIPTKGSVSVYPGLGYPFVSWNVNYTGISYYGSGDGPYQTLNIRTDTDGGTQGPYLYIIQAHPK